jgi:hypothetical protein
MNYFIQPNPATTSLVYNPTTQLGHGHQSDDHTGKGASPDVEGRVNGEVSVFTDPDGTLAAVKFLGASACQLCKAQGVECYRTPNLRFRPQMWSSGGASSPVLDLRKIYVRSRCENCFKYSTSQVKCPIPGGIGVFRVKECIVRPLDLSAQARSQDIDTAATVAVTRHIDGENHSYETSKPWTVSRAGRAIKVTHKRRIGSIDDDSDGVTEADTDQGTEYTPSQSAPGLSSSHLKPSSAQLWDPSAYAVKRRRQELSKEPPAPSTSISVTPNSGGSESKSNEGKGNMDLINRLLNSQEETRKLIERQQRSIEVHQAREQVIWDAVAKGNL